MKQLRDHAPLARTASTPRQLEITVRLRLATRSRASCYPPSLRTLETRSARQAAARYSQLSVSEAQSSDPRGDAIHTSLAESPSSRAAFRMLNRAPAPSGSR